MRQANSRGGHVERFGFVYLPTVDLDHRTEIIDRLRNQCLAATRPTEFTSMPSETGSGSEFGGFTNACRARAK